MEIEISAEIQKAFDLSGENIESEIQQFLDSKVERQKMGIRENLNTDKTLIELDNLKKVKK